MGRGPLDGVEKDDRVRIRCTSNTRKDFKSFAGYYPTQAAALRDLLRVARENPGLTTKFTVPTSSSRDENNENGNGDDDDDDQP